MKENGIEEINKAADNAFAPAEKERRPKRPARVPLGIRNVLTAPNKAGYIRRFVNDEPDRIRQFEAAGYSVVPRKIDTQVGDKKVGKELKPGSRVSLSVGGGTTAVLMEIRKDWYDEDQQTKQDKIKLSEDDMKQQINAKKDGGIYGEVSII